MTCAARTLWPPEQAAELQAQLDELQRAKLRLADEVLVVAPGGYLGASTQAAIAYAAELGRPVRHWRPDPTRPAPGVPAGAVSGTWWWLLCEDCGASSLDEDEEAGLFRTPEQAAQPRDPQCWSVYQQVSRCPDCAARACAGGGHAWSAWRESEHSMHVDRVVDRWCERCGQRQEHLSARRRP